MVSQPAGRSPALRSEWATSGGTATKPPEGTVIVFLAPDLEGEFALENVEGVRVLVVNVRAGNLFAGWYRPRITVTPRVATRRLM